MCKQFLESIERANESRRAATLVKIVKDDPLSSRCMINISGAASGSVE